MLCNYCGEEEGTVTIPDPNDIFSGKKWRVCEICKEVIICQRTLSVCQRVGDKKMIAFYVGELAKLAKKSGKPIMSVQMGNNGDHQEIVFGEDSGESDED